MARCAQLLEEYTSVDFVDINMGCPIDMVCNKCDPLTHCPTMNIVYRSTANPTKEQCCHVRHLPT